MTPANNSIVNQTITKNNYHVSFSSITIAQLLLVSKTELGSVVDLGPDTAVTVQLVLASQAEASGVGAGSPSQLDTSLQIGVDLLVQGASELLAVVDVAVQRKVLGSISDGEVVARQLRFGQIERHLVTGQPALVTGYSRSVDGAGIQINVSVHRDRVVLELGLDDTRLLSKRKTSIYF